jgi:hypothetical protein
MKALKLLLVLAVCVMATGCVNRMPNDDIIAEALKCERVGLPWKPIYNYDGTVKLVNCTPINQMDIFKPRS